MQNKDFTKFPYYLAHRIQKLQLNFLKRPSMTSPNLPFLLLPLQRASLILYCLTSCSLLTLFFLLVSHCCFCLCASFATLLFSPPEDNDCPSFHVIGDAGEPAEGRAFVHLSPQPLHLEQCLADKMCE